MLELSNSDYKLLESLVSLTQEELKMSMAKYLKSKYKECILTQEYLVAIGDIPIALVAHMDTVFKTPAYDLYYDREKGVLWSPQGLGADDRAGVFAIIKIIQAGYRPSIIFTTDEEKGGVGAAALNSAGPCPIPNLKYMIELDRRGKNDCVFYDCYCPEFTEYVSSFGFCEKYGTFSDISFLMSDWEICGVNLSVGYEDEHSYAETLHIRALYDTIDKVKRMLSKKEIPDFKYDEALYQDSTWWKHLMYGAHCSRCKSPHEEYELFPVKGLDGTPKFYCCNCIADHVDWCDECKEAYEVEDIKEAKHLCKECAEKYNV